MSLNLVGHNMNVVLIQIDNTKQQDSDDTNDFGEQRSSENPLLKSHLCKSYGYESAWYVHVLT